MEYLILIIIVTLSNIAVFVTGAIIGYKSKNNQEIKIKTPVEAIKEYKENKINEKEQNRVNQMLENINNYAGDSIGQKEIN